MAYKLKADESVADGVKRVILGEIDNAEAMLRQEGEERDAGIHDARGRRSRRSAPSCA